MELSGQPYWEVMSKVREAREKIYGGHAGSYRAMHLRRGVDKCTDSQNPDDPSIVGEVRCGSMKNMPFLKQCKGDPKAAEGAASRPLYVATDEADDKEIKVKGGCQVEHISLTPRVESAWFQLHLLESTVSFKPFGFKYQPAFPTSRCCVTRGA